MRRSTPIAWLLALAVPLWMASQVVDRQPVYATAAVLAVLLFSAFAVANADRT